MGKSAFEHTTNRAITSCLILQSQLRINSLLAYGVSGICGTSENITEAFMLACS